MKRFDIHMEFEFPNDNSAVMQDCALCAFGAIESKPDDYDLRGDNLIIEFRNREFPSRFEALSWAKSLEEKILPEISVSLYRKRAEIVVCDSKPRKDQ